MMTFLTALFAPSAMPDLMLRILCSALCGMLIGLERDIHGRAAGLRTHTLVAIGSALFTVISILITVQDPASPPRGDLGRIAAQIVSGVGFLGAGTIIKTGITVKGLTTAACLWFVAALGMACGMNLCLPALTIAVLVLLLVFAGKRIEKSLHRLYPFRLTVELNDPARANDLRDFILASHGYDITSMNLTLAFQDHAVPCKVTFYVDTSLNTTQPEACLILTRNIRNQFPDILSITYTCEG